MAKNVNYSAALTAKIVDEYQAGVAVEAIAEAVEKSVRSVRSKLVREGVYVAAPKKTARKSDEPTKKELLIQLEAVAPFAVDGFRGETKEAINEMLKYFSEH